MKFLKILLKPLGLLYGLVMSIRNKCFDLHIFKGESYDLPVIGVGNLSVGGTGKTPMIAWLLKKFSNNYNTAVLSRGYNRKSKGYKLATESSTALEIGDEAYQLKQSFPHVQLAVSEKRIEGMQKLLALQNPPELVFLDDNFQHRWVRASFQILLTSYSNPYFNDSVLPAGRLREPKSGSIRAQAIVVTKCPDKLTGFDRIQFRNNLGLSAHQSCFFTGIRYAQQPAGTDKKTFDDFQGSLLVTGIANPKPLLDFLSNKGINIKHLSFPDHHNFSAKDLKKIEKLSDGKAFLTTEKDAARLEDLVSKNRIYTIPIEPYFLDDESAFVEVLNKVISAPTAVQQIV